MRSPFSVVLTATITIGWNWNSPAQTTGGVASAQPGTAQSPSAVATQLSGGAGVTPGFTGSDIAPNTTPGGGANSGSQTGLGNSFPANSLRNAPNTSVSGSFSAPGTAAGTSAVQQYGGNATADRSTLADRSHMRVNINRRFQMPPAPDYYYGNRLPNQTAVNPNMPVKPSYGFQNSLPQNFDPNTPLQPSPNDLNAWRFANHNGTWWYWMPTDYWMTWNGNTWNRYTPASAPPINAFQPAR
jgi:hypothetical protein